MSLLSQLWKMIASIFRQTTTTTTTGTTTPRIDGKIKLCLAMGLNDYPGTVNDLAGCVNDCEDFGDYFKGLNFNRIDRLIDSNVNYTNFVDKIKDFANINPDVVVITNSSHGTSLPDNNGDEADGKDEAWCMYDRNVRDDDIRKVLDLLPEKTTVIIFSDSCFSGGVTRAFLSTMNDNTYVSKPKYLPPSDNTEALNLSLLPVINPIVIPKASKNEVLFSGCKSNEYSYDAEFNGRPNGAFTYYCLKVLKENPGITYEDFYKKLCAYLPCSAYPQSPQFEPSNTELGQKVMFE